jgi:hypothetical protein
LFEVSEYSASYGASHTAHHFLDRMLNSGMSVGCQKLRKLKQHGAAENDQAQKAICRG